MECPPDILRNSFADPFFTAGRPIVTLIQNTRDLFPRTVRARVLTANESGIYLLTDMSAQTSWFGGLLWPKNGSEHWIVNGMFAPISLKQFAVLYDNNEAVYDGCDKFLFQCSPREIKYSNSDSFTESIAVRRNQSGHWR